MVDATIASVTGLKLSFFSNFSESGVRTDCQLPEKASVAMKFLGEQKKTLYDHFRLK